jgi:CubicO group peptidase (beta-lactamase class C family)
VWEYSWGVDVLARVVEVASGEPFGQFLQSRVFGPLHMVDTGFYVPEVKLFRLVDPPIAERYRQFDIARPRKLLSGGGGPASTAPDFLAIGVRRYEKAADRRRRRDWPRA